MTMADTYLDKFAVLDDAQGEGLGRAVWQVMRDETSAPVLALAPSQHHQPFLLRRIRRLLQGAGVESVLVRHARLRRHRALRDAMPRAAGDPGRARMSTQATHWHRRRARPHRRRADQSDRAASALELAFVSSRELAGQRVAGSSRRILRRPALRNSRCRSLRRKAASTSSCWPCRTARLRPMSRRSMRQIHNALSSTYLPTIVSTQRWYYGLPELYRAQVSRPAPHQQSRLLRDGDAAGDRAAEGSAGRAAGVFRRVRLFRRRHDAVGQERSGKAARQPDSVLAGRSHCTSAKSRAISACRSNSCRTSRRIFAASR